MLEKFLRFKKKYDTESPILVVQPAMLSDFVKCLTLSNQELAEQDMRPFITSRHLTTLIPSVSEKFLRFKNKYDNESRILVV